MRSETLLYIKHELFVMGQRGSRMAEYSLGILMRASAVLAKVTAVFMSPFSATIETFNFFYIAVSCWDCMALVIDTLLQMSIAGVILTRKKKHWFFYEWQQTSLYVNKCSAI